MSEALPKPCWSYGSPPAPEQAALYAAMQTRRLIELHGYLRRMLLLEITEQVLGLQR